MKRSSSSGFTIVELMIVIVVIGILATIAFVNYSGAQTIAKTNSAKATALALQHKIESYGNNSGNFPADPTVGAYTTQLNSFSDSSIRNVGINIGTPSALNGTNTVEVSKCTSPAAVVTATSYRIRWWDFGASPPGLVPDSAAIKGSYATVDCDVNAWQPLGP